MQTQINSSTFHTWKWNKNILFWKMNPFQIQFPSSWKLWMILAIFEIIFLDNTNIDQFNIFHIILNIFFINKISFPFSKAGKSLNKCIFDGFTNCFCFLKFAFRIYVIDMNPPLAVPNHWTIHPPSSSYFFISGAAKPLKILLWNIQEVLCHTQKLFDNNKKRFNNVVLRNRRLITLI